jgi:hypothetical protein
VAVIKPGLINTDKFLMRAQYEEDIRRKQLEIERMYMMQQYKDLPIQQQSFQAPPLQSLRKRNQRLLLCRP